MNRRRFLQKAIGAAGALAIGTSILPQAVKAGSPKLPPKVDKVEGLEGGYFVPSEYVNDLEVLIRRDYAEQVSLMIDREALRGTSPLEPVGLLNHDRSKAIGKRRR